MLSIPAYLSYLMYNKLPIKNLLSGWYSRGSIGNDDGMYLIMLLALTDARFASGDFSVVQIIIVGHLPYDW